MPVVGMHATKYAFTCTYPIVKIIGRKLSHNLYEPQLQLMKSISLLTSKKLKLFSSDAIVALVLRPLGELYQSQ